MKKDSKPLLPSVSFPSQGAKPLSFPLTGYSYDETWKEAIGDYFDSFLAFFYPQVYQQIDWTKTPISLDKELEQITASAESKTRHADKLFQVWLLDN